MIADAAMPPSRTRIAFYWIALPLIAVSWSFALSSFQHAKEIVLVAAVLPAIGLALPERAPLAAGLRLFLPLWCLLALQVIRLLWGGPFMLPSDTFNAVARIVIIVVFALASWDLVSDQARRHHVLGPIVLGGVLCAALALLQRAGGISFVFPVYPHYDQTMYSVFGNQGGLGAYCALTLVVAIVLARHKPAWRWTLFAATVLLLIAVLLSGARSAWLALGLGGGMLLLQAAHVSRRGRSLAVLGATAAVMLVLLTFPELRAKWIGAGIGEEARLWFWEGAWLMFRDRPMLGQGLGSFAFASPYFQGLALGGDWPNRFHNELHTFHAHNDLLELLAETGLVGTALIVWQGARLFVRKPVALAPILVYAVIACFNAAWTNTPLLIAALILLLPTALPEAPRTNPKALLALFLVTLAACVQYIGGELVPSYLRGQATAAHTAGLPSLDRYERCRAWPWPDYQAAEFHAMALMDVGDYERAADALAYARQGLDTGRVHLLSGDVARALGDLDAARQHYAACLVRWPWKDRAREW